MATKRLLATKLSATLTPRTPATRSTSRLPATPATTSRLPATPATTSRLPATPATTSRLSTRLTPSSPALSTWGAADWTVWFHAKLCKTLPWPGETFLTMARNHMPGQWFEVEL